MYTDLFFYDGCLFFLDFIFRVVVGFKDVQLVGIVCEREYFNYGV